APPRGSRRDRALRGDPRSAQAGPRAHRAPRGAARQAGGARAEHLSQGGAALARGARLSRALRPVGLLDEGGRDRPRRLREVPDGKGDRAAGRRQRAVVVRAGDGQGHERAPGRVTPVPRTAHAPARPAAALCVYTRSVALKSTVYKADLAVADVDRGVYADHALTLARHPSETDERMMVRLLAFA